jgi:hypothetical protein
MPARESAVRSSKGDIGTQVREVHQDESNPTLTLFRVVIG